MTIVAPPRGRPPADERRATDVSPPRARPRLWTWVVLVGALIAFTFVMTHERTRLQHSLARERAALHDAKAALADTKRALSTASAQTTNARARTTRAKHDAAVAVQQKQLIDRAISNNGSTLTGVNQQLNQTLGALFVTAGHVNEVTHCLDGVSSASTADNAGNTAAAVKALNDSAGDCAKTAALTSGALVPYDFPDPYVLHTGGAYYAYSTNSGAGDIQVLRSTDLITWRIMGNGLAHIPAWAAPHGTWAPSVLQRGKTYVVYYTVPDHSGRRCISRAVAPNPSGPFVDNSASPLVCDGASGGAIDPSPFVDASGQAYLIWKAQSGPPVIWSQPLSSDGLSLTGRSSALLGVSRSLEHGVVEAPSMLEANGRYFLIYAAGDWHDASYTTAYATCAGPAGPCSKPSNNQLLVSGSRMVGPGGAEAFRAADGSLFVAFHAYSSNAVGYPNSRYFHIARLHVDGDRLTVDAQT